MNKEDLATETVEEVEQKLAEMFGKDLKDRQYPAALLLAELQGRFDAARATKVPVLGAQGISEWVESFRRRNGVSTRTMYYYIEQGRFLAKRITKDQFNALGFDKRRILCEIGEAGRLEQNFIEASVDMPIKELRRRAARLLGPEIPWEENLIIDSHEAAEAALLRLGYLLGYKTYTADRAKLYEGKNLGEYANLVELPHFPTEEIDNCASRIDVVWVQREWAKCFFEIENTTNVTSGLQRMFQVLECNAKFFIVAPEDRHARFRAAISQAPYSEHKDKYLFRSYTQLDEMFQAARQYRKAKQDFFKEED